MMSLWIRTYPLSAGLSSKMDKFLSVAGKSEMLVPTRLCSFQSRDYNDLCYPWRKVERGKRLPIPGADGGKDHGFHNPGPIHRELQRLSALSKIFYAPLSPHPSSYRHTFYYLLPAGVMDS